MAMPPLTDYVKLAQSLPPPLLRFFARFPPPPSALHKSTSNAHVTTALNTSSSDPNASAVETSAPSLPYENPFTPTRHPVTGRWRDPVYSLRRQADICKLARHHGIEDLLPPTVKSSDARLQKRAEQGLRVRGTGIGQRVKGTVYERTMRKRLETRRQAMLRMPKLVQQWRQLGHGRGWKKFPK